MSELHVLKMKINIINNNSVGDSDDIDMAASDFSHSYALWKLSVGCLNNSISDNGSKVKKPQIKLRDGSNAR